MLERESAINRYLDIDVVCKNCGEKLSARPELFGVTDCGSTAHEPKLTFIHTGSRLAGCEPHTVAEPEDELGAWGAYNVSEEKSRVRVEASVADSPRCTEPKHKMNFFKRLWNRITLARCRGCGAKLYDDTTTKYCEKCDHLPLCPQRYNKPPHLCLWCETERGEDPFGNAPRLARDGRPEAFDYWPDNCPVGTIDGRAYYKGRVVHDGYLQDAD